MISLRKKEEKKLKEIKVSAKDKPKIGVYVCHCGTNIAGTVDVEEVSKWAGEELKDQGVEVIEWSEADLRAVRMVSRDIWDEFAQKSPMTKKVLDSQKAWLKELGLID